MGETKEIETIKKWNLTVEEDGVPLPPRTWLPRNRWMAEIKGFIQQSSIEEVVSQFKAQSTIELEFPRVWWQWLIPIRRFYTLKDAKIEKISDSLEFEVRGAIGNPQPSWRWYFPKWLKKICERKR